MTGNPKQPQLAPVIRATLEALRRRMRSYLWLEGLGAEAFWLGTAFWISLAIDWLFEPVAAGSRFLVDALAARAFLAALWFLVIRRITVPISYSNLAMLLERRFPQFGDSLLTAVDLADPANRTTGCNPYLLAQACRQAEGPCRLRAIVGRPSTPGRCGGISSPARW